MKTPLFSALLCLTLSTQAFAADSITDLAITYFKSGQPADALVLARELLSEPSQSAYDRKMIVLIDFLNSDLARTVTDRKQLIAALGEIIEAKRKGYNDEVIAAADRAATTRRIKAAASGAAIGAATGAILSQLKFTRVPKAEPFQPVVGEPLPAVALEPAPLGGPVFEPVPTSPLGGPVFEPVPTGPLGGPVFEPVPTGPLGGPVFEPVPTGPLGGGVFEPLPTTGPTQLTFGSIEPTFAFYEAPPSLGTSLGGGFEPLPAPGTTIGGLGTPGYVDPAIGLPPTFPSNPFPTTSLPALDPLATSGPFAPPAATSPFGAPTVDPFPTGGGLPPLAPPASPGLTIGRTHIEIAPSLERARAGAALGALIGSTFVVTGSENEVVGFRSVPILKKSAAERAKILEQSTPLDKGGK